MSSGKEAHGNGGAELDDSEHLLRAIEEHQRPALEELAARSDAAWRDELHRVLPADLAADRIGEQAN